MTLARLTNGSARDLPSVAQEACVPSVATRRPPACVYLRACPLLGQTSNFRVLLASWATINLRREGRKRGKENLRVASYKDVILKSLLLSDPTSFSSIQPGHRERVFISICRKN